MCTLGLLHSFRLAREVTAGGRAPTSNPARDPGRRLRDAPPSASAVRADPPSGERAAFPTLAGQVNCAQSFQTAGSRALPQTGRANLHSLRAARTHDHARAEAAEGPSPGWRD